MADNAQHLGRVKQLMKAMWTSGDFGQIAKHMESDAEEFVARLNLKTRLRVLDVGCGTGNQAIPAARTGAQVAAVDIAPNLLAQAAERAKQEGLNIELREADAEALPFADGEFDVVMTMFAAMFAPQPERMVAEALRVCRPGGLIAMGNWTRDSLVARQNEIMARFAPPPPGSSNPFDWGEESVVRERFGNRAELRCTRREFIFDLPLGPEEAEEYFRRHLGPIKTVMSRLDDTGKQHLMEELRKLWVDENQGGASHTVIPSEYLEVHARRK